MTPVLYVADDIQELASRKVLTVGLYPDRVITANVPRGAPKPSDQHPIVMPTLALMLSIPNTQPGHYEIALDLVGPAKQSVRDGLPPDQVFEQRQAGCLNLIVTVAPFRIRQTGEYRLLATINGKVVEGAFEVRLHEEG